MMWDLVIFDCDGVLVDSEPIADSVFSAILRDEGFVVPREKFIEWFVGYSLSKCIETVRQEFGRPLPEDIPQKYYDRLFNEFRLNLQPIPGIQKTLEAMRWPFCVASSGEHEKMQVSLGATGLLSRFTGKMFSATEVARGKPAPDLFLYAARQSNASPERCAVVEDSLPGIKAGIAAGMTVFAYQCVSNPHQEQLIASLGATVFNQMEDLPRLLDSL